MANPNRGGTAVKVGEEEFTFSFSTNAMCELEDAVDLPMMQIVAKLQDRDTLRIGFIRRIVWAALLDHHPGITLEAAGDLLTKVGVNAALPAIGRAFTAAFPAVEEKGAARPQRAAARA